MPRSRGLEMPQRQPLRGIHQVRSSSSNPDPLHHRPITDRSSHKLGDRCSPRGASRSDPLSQKKLGTRIAHLESQLGQAQEELKILKDQLASAEAAKKEAQEKLEKRTKKLKAPEPVEFHEKISPEKAQHSKKTDSSSIGDEVPKDNQRETVVFQVPVEKIAIKPKVEIDEIDQVQEETKAIGISTEGTTVLELEKQSLHELASKDNEINVLKSDLEAKEKQLRAFTRENEDLKTQLNEMTLNISAAEAKKDEMALSLRQVGEELEASTTMAAQLKEKLQLMEAQKEALEAEMKKLKVQTEQWRKAADAATAILSGGEQINDRLSNTCRSMDKHFSGTFQPLACAYAGYNGSPGLGGNDNSFGSGKRKGSGIKMFTDLWKNKGQK